VVTWHSRQEQEKNEKYVVRCHRRGWTFVPFVIDVFGGYGQEALDLVGTLLKGALGQREGWLRRGLEAEIWQGLSMALVRELGRQLAWGTFQVGLWSAPACICRTPEQWGQGLEGWRR